MHDGSRCIPIRERAGHDREEHVIASIVLDDFRGPVAVVLPAVPDSSGAAVRPCCPAVGGFGDPDPRAVDPVHADGILQVRAAVRIEHEPSLLLAIPDDHGIGRTVVDGVAIQRFWCQDARPSRRRFGGYLYLDTLLIAEDLQSHPASRRDGTPGSKEFVKRVDPRAAALEDHVALPQATSRRPALRRHIENNHADLSRKAACRDLAETDDVSYSCPEPVDDAAATPG